ncbi:hypothetical protein ABTM60_20350, partial [Acinetobacter baumannii]
MFKRWLSRGKPSASTVLQVKASVTHLPRKASRTLGPTAHVDTFTRDNLPPFEAWPDIYLDRPE